MRAAWIVLAVMLAGCPLDPERGSSGASGGGGVDAGNDGPSPDAPTCPHVECPTGTVGACEVVMPADCSAVVQPNGTLIMCCVPASCGGVPACPVGAFTACAPGDTTVECCTGGAVIQACARAFGTLTRECPVYGLTCASSECAVDLPHGAVACCSSHDPLDPCSQ